MDSAEIDVQKTRKFERKTYLWKQMPLALGILVLGMMMFLWADHGTRAGRQSVLAGGILIAAGLLFAGYLMFREAHPEKPMIELSPSGVLYRITPQKEVNIPWHEIKAVGSIDITGPRRVVFRKVTAATVSRRFYEEHIHIDSRFARGPFWGAYVIEDGAQVKLAFHHEFASVPASDMRTAVEARWLKYRDGP